MIKFIFIQPECSVILFNLNANGFELNFFLQMAAISWTIVAFISVLQKEEFEVLLLHGEVFFLPINGAKWF